MQKFISWWITPASSPRLTQIRKRKRRSASQRLAWARPPVLRSGELGSWHTCQAERRMMDSKHGWLVVQISSMKQNLRREMMQAVLGLAKASCIHSNLLKLGVKDSSEKEQNPQKSPSKGARTASLQQLLELYTRSLNLPKPNASSSTIVTTEVMIMFQKRQSLPSSHSSKIWLTIKQVKKRECVQVRSTCVENSENMMRLRTALQLYENHQEQEWQFLELDVTISLLPLYQLFQVLTEPSADHWPPAFATLNHHCFVANDQPFLSVGVRLERKQQRRPDESNKHNHHLFRHKHDLARSLNVSNQATAVPSALIVTARNAFHSLPEQLELRLGVEDQCSLAVLVPLPVDESGAAWTQLSLTLL